MGLRILAVIKKELRQLARDRQILAVLLLVPLALLILFGYVVSLDVKHLPLAVCDLEKSARSRRLIEAFSHSEFFDLRDFPSHPDEIDRLLDRGQVRAALVIPRDFSKRITREKEVEVQVIVDGTDANTASTALGYIQTVIQNETREMTGESLLLRIGLDPRPVVDYRPRVWFNPELRSANYLVPGLIALILLITAVISTSLSVVREKERRTMEQLRVSPLRPLELIVGKTVPYIFISLAVTAGILLASHLLFDVSNRGSYPLLLLVVLLFLLGCLGLGLLISAVSETQQVAFMISVLSTFLPSFILSGFVFPIRNMPVIIRVVTYFIPARYFLSALRSIMLKGVGLADFWEQVLGLAAFAALTLLAGAARLRR